MRPIDNTYRPLIVGRNPRSTSPKQSSSLLAFGWLAFGVGLATGIALTLAQFQVEGAAVVILSMAPLMLQLNARLFPGFPIGPVTFLYFYHALGYAIGPLWQQQVIGYLYAVYREGLVPAQWGGVLGLLTIALVFPRVFRWTERMFATSNNSNALRIDSAKWANYTVFLTIAVLGSIVFGFFSGAGNRLGGLTGTIAAASLVSATKPLHYPLFFFLGFQATQRRMAWRLVWIASLLAYSAFYALDGGRGAAIFALIFSGMGLAYGGMSMRRIIVVGLIAAIPIVPLSGVILDYRGQASGYVGTRLDTRLDAFSLALDEFSQFQANDLSNSTAAFARGVTAAFVDRVFMLTPRIIPFAGFEDIELIPYALTPTVINPDRPDLNDGNRLAILYGGAQEGTFGSYMPTVGDGYRRFGWPGVVALYALAATVFAIPIAASWVRRGQRHWMAFFVFLIFQSGQIWSVTLITLATMVLWVFMRTWITMWLPAWILDRVNR